MKCFDALEEAAHKGIGCLCLFFFFLKRKHNLGIGKMFPFSAMSLCNRVGYKLLLKIAQGRQDCLHNERQDHVVSWKLDLEDPGRFTSLCSDDTCDLGPVTIS